MPTPRLALPRDRPLTAMSSAAPPTIGGDTTAPESPLATSELVDAIIEAIKAGSDDADFSESIAAVREAAEAAGLDKEQIDTLIAFLKQAIESGDVPEGQLEEIGETAPSADEAGQADKAGDTIGGDDATAEVVVRSDQAIKLAVLRPGRAAGRRLALKAHLGSAGSGPSGRVALRRPRPPGHRPSSGSWEGIPVGGGDASPVRRITVRESRHHRITASPTRRRGLGRAPAVRSHR